VGVAQAIYDNQAEWPDELAFERGEILRVLNERPCKKVQYFEKAKERKFSQKICVKCAALYKLYAFHLEYFFEENLSMGKVKFYFTNITKEENRLLQYRIKYNYVDFRYANCHTITIPVLNATIINNNGARNLLFILSTNSGVGINTGWWCCINKNGRRGIVPANRLRMLHRFDQNTSPQEK
uniref:SH3 domain-containing protein n=1 Tax=Elaeophora elaphi TaxID=1147741 RepID=A0A0R3RK22_9BILA